MCMIHSSHTTTKNSVSFTQHNVASFHKHVAIKNKCTLLCGDMKNEVANSLVSVGQGSEKLEQFHVNLNE